jgi:hypothetical protein
MRLFVLRATKGITDQMSSEPRIQHAPQPELDAYSIDGFCRRHSISRSTYYNLKQVGKAPLESHALGQVLITKESAQAWRKMISEQ